MESQDGSVESEMISEKELEARIRQILIEQDAERRKAANEELQQHRQFLERMVNLVIRGLGIILLFGSAAFVYFFGRSVETAESKLDLEISQKLIEFRVVEEYKKRLNDELQRVIESEEISGKLKEEAAKAAGDEVNERVRRAVEANLSEVDNSQLEEILQRLVAAEFAKRNPRSLAIFADPVFRDQKTSELLDRALRYLRDRPDADSILFPNTDPEACSSLGGSQTPGGCFFDASKLLLLKIHETQEPSPNS